MPHPDDPQKNPAPTTISARVRQISPIGLIVVLDNGRDGVVREREIAWDAAARHGWRERYRPGQIVQVVALKKSLTKRPEFSLRLAHHDPWLDIEDRYPVGSLVDGQVTGVMSYGVFVELEPGVTGLVHKSHFPTWASGRPETTFWPSDFVKVIVVGLDTVRRRIELSMTGLRRRRWEAGETASVMRSTRQQMAPSGQSKQQYLPIEGLHHFGAKLILVVDDNLRICTELAGWLRNAGHIVLMAHDGETALQVINESAPEVVLIDIELPDQSGLQIVQILRTTWPEIRGILMTGQCEVYEHDTELISLIEADVPLLCKPFRPEELLACLYDRPAARQVQAAKKLRHRQGATTPSYTEASSSQTERLWLSKTLARLRGVTHADFIVLFMLDPESRQVRLLEQVGQSALRHGSFPSLLHSPVRDVAEDGLILRALSTQETAHPRFRHLSTLISFSSCLGIPVPAQLSERYALFLFFEQPVLGDAAAIVEAHASSTTALLAARLERQHFAHQFAGLQRVMLLGQLSRSLIHEINNQRQNLPQAVVMLKDQLQAIVHAAGRDSTQLMWEIAEAEETLQDLGQELDRLVGATEPFVLLTRQNQHEFMLLDQMIQTAADVVRDTARRANIMIDLFQLAPVCFTRAPSATIQQVLVNILLNAIQHIELTHGRCGGRVRVTLSPEPTDGHLFFRISVEDDGPGIHRRLWERIFEMGYTERTDGSGMGLFISRNLIESLGGRVWVTESAKGWGSTFVIELPQQN